MVSAAAEVPLWGLLPLAAAHGELHPGLTLTLTKTSCPGDFQIILLHFSEPYANARVSLLGIAATSTTTGICGSGMPTGTE